MAHDSCTIILNGHGCYSPDRVLNIGACPNDYSIFFPCSHREAVTASHHNLIFADLTTCEKDQITTRLEIMEAPLTASVVNKQSPALGFATDMMTMHHSTILFDHALSNAPEMVRAHTLEHANGVAGNGAQRFCSTELFVIPDPGMDRNWGHGKLQIDFDLEDVQANVLASLGQASSVLTATQLISIRPTAPQDEKANFLLSDLIDTIIPRIKIFASEHTDGSVDVLPHVFLDDRNDPGQNLVDCVANFPVFQNPGDTLHALTVAGDANIIWDACRDVSL